jgi:hypothetical protein
MSATRGRLCAFVLLGACALGNAGAIGLATGAWRVAEAPAAAMPCHGVPAPDTQPDEGRQGCQWAAPAACCDSPQTADTRGLELPSLLVVWSGVASEPGALRESAPERAIEPPLPVPRNARVLLV